MRDDQRRPEELRPIKIKRRFTRPSPGSVLIQAGRTTVLCTASVEESVPPWMVGQHRGWITAEYSMLPSSTTPRRRRERDGRPEGRSTEIQRLIGRSLRAVADLAALGQRTIAIDCDVLEADGGTRTAAITGAYVALAFAVRKAAAAHLCEPNVLKGAVAAVSVGIVDGKALLDLDYNEDSAAEVDMNVAMTRSGRFVEIQGSSEKAPFDTDQLDRMLRLARRGIRKLLQSQREVLR